MSALFKRAVLEAATFASVFTFAVTPKRAKFLATVSFLFHLLAMPTSVKRPFVGSRDIGIRVLCRERRLFFDETLPIIYMYVTIIT